MNERRFQMRRLGAGDYVCPSNDLALMWRFHSYTDGRIHGLDVAYEARTFWRACHMPMDRFRSLAAESGDIPEPWNDAWTESEWCLPSRAACVERMLSYAPVSR